MILDFDDVYELSVEPRRIQLFASEAHERSKNVKRIIEDELYSLNQWHSNFHKNLKQLFDVTPFYESGKGYFEQELYGEWSASGNPPDIDEVIAMHSYVDLGSIDKSEGAEQTWSEKFTSLVKEEATEVFEGAKNFANNALSLEDTDTNGVDPGLIHS